MILLAGITAIIIGIVFILIGYYDSNSKDPTCLGVIAGIWLMIGLAAILSHFTEPSPKAIDVYRGNTTLEITYRDTIPVDSVVVFKNIND